MSVPMIKQSCQNQPGEDRVCLVYIRRSWCNTGRHYSRYLDQMLWKNAVSWLVWTHA